MYRPSVETDAEPARVTVVVARTIRRVANETNIQLQRAADELGSHSGPGARRRHHGTDISPAYITS